MPESVRVYFDTMLYINKFEDVFKIRPETNNIFSKVKSGEYHLVVSQLTFVEMYHVMCLPLAKLSNVSQAQDALKEIVNAYDAIKTKIMEYPNTEFPEHEFNGIDTRTLTDFIEKVPGSALIDFVGMNKYPGSMDFIHLMVAMNLKCDKFFTEDKGVILLDSYNQKGNMKIIKPYR